MVTRINLSRTTLSSLAIATLFSVGCVNLNEQRPSLLSLGKNAATSVANRAPVAATTKAMQRAFTPKQDGFVAKLRNVLPKRATRTSIPDQMLADDDPTRLDSKPTKLGPDLYIAAARLAERNGDYDLALDQYNLALKTDERNRNALIGIARLNHRGGDMQAAIRLYRDALNSYPNDAVIMNDLGLCYARIQRLDEAIGMLQAASQAAPDRKMYVNNLAAALVETGRTGEAIAQLARLHGPATANYNVGYLLDRAGKKSEAATFLNRSLSIDPNLQPAKILLANITPQLSSRPQIRPTSQPFQGQPGQPSGPPQRDGDLSPSAAAYRTTAPAGPTTRPAQNNMHRF